MEQNGLARYWKSVERRLLSKYVQDSLLDLFKDAEVYDCSSRPHLIRYSRVHQELMLKQLE